MFFVRRPSERDIVRFLDDSRALPFSYGAIGIARAGIHPGRVDEDITRIGHGAADFDRARNALTQWKHVDLSWVQLFPRSAPTEVGTTVAVRIEHLGFWSLNGARVVYHLDDSEAGSRFGFAYGTLTNHAEHGEELFEISFDPRTGDVMYRIRAISWPQAPLAWIGYPIVRSLQARFRQDSAAAMRRAIGHASRPNSRS